MTDIPTVAQLLRRSDFELPPLNFGLPNYFTFGVMNSANPCGSVKLECPFHFLGCQHAYDLSRRNQWVAHSMTHFATQRSRLGSRVFPEEFRCLFCPMTFCGVSSSGSWIQMLHHLSYHCLFGATISSVPPDHRLVDFLQSQGLIDENTWHKLAKELWREGSELYTSQTSRAKVYRQIRVRKRKGLESSSILGVHEPGSDKQNGNHHASHESGRQLVPAKEKRKSLVTLRPLRFLDNDFHSSYGTLKRQKTTRSKEWARTFITASIERYQMNLDEPLMV